MFITSYLRGFRLGGQVNIEIKNTYNLPCRAKSKEKTRQISLNT